jgi:hypothetical protein
VQQTHALGLRNVVGGELVAGDGRKASMGQG